MRLDPDCIRDVLLAIEEKSGFQYSILINKNNYKEIEILKKYEYNVIGYHIKQCNLYGYFTSMKQSIDGSFVISDLSPQAHEFLANIRSETVWSKVKHKASEIGTFSISALAQIAINYVSSKIN